MYIHGYQIHNVLNVYRKQLSHGTGGNSAKKLPSAENNDRISISAEGQRQSIMDKVSSEIVSRIAQSGPKNQFEKVLADRVSSHAPGQEGPEVNHAPEFKYTAIDENNRKTTNTLTIRGFSPTNQTTEPKAGEHNGNEPVPEMD